MKKTLILLLLITIWINDVNCQNLTSKIDGKVLIKNENPSGFPFKSLLIETGASSNSSDQILGIDSRIKSGVGWAIGIQGVASTPIATSSGRAFGVRGLAANATPGANFGLWGELQGIHNGAALLAWDRLSKPNWSQVISGDRSWAGYFYGGVHIADDLGIGTINPVAKLQVSQGDVYIEDIGKGIIMKSADGQCWRYTPDNIGQLVPTAITCPN